MGIINQFHQVSETDRSEPFEEEREYDHER